MTAEDLSVPAAELMIVGHYDKVAGYVTRRPGGSPSWLLFWTEAGAGFVEQGGVSFEVGVGDLVVLGSGVAQRYRVRPGARRWRFWWVHFQPRASWAAWLGPYARDGGCHVVAGVPQAVHERIELAFRRALQDARWTPEAPEGLGRGADREPLAGLRTGADREAPEGGGTGADHETQAGAGVGADREAPTRARLGADREAVGGARGGGELEGWVPAVVVGGAARELVLGAVEEVLVLATASTRPEGRGEEGDGRVRRALAMITAEPGAPHSVASLARAVALSPSRFAHLFAAETGQTPMQAVRQARVRHAASLLEVTDMDVGQVAAASGFVSPFHFSRAFRKEYGLPPRDYRARLRPTPA